MLSATATTSHVHAASSCRPDRVYATGVWQPYPLEADPSAVVRQTISSFVKWVRPEGPMVSQERQPEEVAMAAERVATAMANGASMRTIDPRLIKAARFILEGKPFVVRSAGRATLVKAASAPGSYEARLQANPATLNVRY